MILSISYLEGKQMTLKRMKEILTHYPKEKPTVFNYFHARNDVLELMRVVLEQQNNFSQTNALPSVADVVISSVVRCTCCDVPIANLDEKGNISTYSNYAVCEVCKKEHCVDCLDKDSDENICVFCGNLHAEKH